MSEPLKSIATLLGLLLVILWVLVVITNVITKGIQMSATLAKNYKRLTLLSHDLKKKENAIKLYSNGLKQCYNRQSSDCSNMEEKLLGLKADYNAFAMDYNKVSKEFEWKSYDNSKRLPILYEMK